MNERSEGIIAAPEGLTAARTERLAASLIEAPFDAFLAVAPANILYASGYRSVAADLFARHRMVAVAAPDHTRLVLPVADSAPAVDAGCDPETLVAYGRFYFESASGARPSRLADQHADWPSALATAVRDAGLASSTLGVDDDAVGPHGLEVIAAALPDATLIPASGWAQRVRANKLDGEVALLERAARLTEGGIDAALAVAAEGWTERQIASVVAATMVAGGASPRFMVVTAGERSALADAFPTDNPWRRGDLLRFDVGCVLDGYWSDMARTAVLGEPTALQRSRYEQLAAGEAAQLEAIRAGVTAGRLFDVAMGTVAERGFGPYRRQHCGHGIGLEVYEPPIVGPDNDAMVETGMVFCLETPYYELGWGGMMCEDTVVVTDGGHRRLTTSSRELRVIES